MARTTPTMTWDSLAVRAWIGRHGGNVSALARRLGVGRTNLQAYATDPSLMRWRTLPPYVQAHMQTLDGLQAWLARWGDGLPAAARAELEQLLTRGPDTE